MVSGRPVCPELTTAHVRLATHTVSGRKAACKILPCLYVPGFPPPSHNEVVDAEEAHKELVILKALSGCKIPGVVELEGVLEEGGWQ
jgi:hypothetical protein